MKKILVVAVLSIMTASIYGQTSPDEIIKKFFSEYEGNPSKAVEDLYATNPWTVRIKDGIDKMKKEVDSYTEDYVGKYYGYEIITKKQFSESFILYSYMVKYDHRKR